MPKRRADSAWRPKFYEYKAKGRSLLRIRLGGKDYYCGAWGTLQAEQRANAIIDEWKRTNVPPNGTARNPQPGNLTVAHLVAAWAEQIDREYRHPPDFRHPKGKPTTELYFAKLVARYVLDVCPDLPIADMRPKHLEEIRNHLLAHRWSRKKPRQHDPEGKPLSRKQINEHVRRVVRIFRWGVSKDLVPPEVLHRLEEFPPLLSGRTTAQDHEQPEPVDWQTVEKTLPYLTRHAAACVQVLWLTGARSGEICRLRPEDIDRSERWAPEWLYRPKRHKTARLGKTKAIWFGPEAQALLRPLLAECQEGEPIFKTIDQPRHRRAHPWLAYYTPDSLAYVIAQACKQAGIPHWYPRQLRSGRATQVEAAMGLEPAAAVLGDRLDTTRHHYARARETARAVARQMG